MAILLAALAHLGYAIGDLFGVVSSRRIGAKATTFWVYFVLLMVFSFASFYFWDQVSLLTPEVVFLNIVLSAAVLFGYLAFVEALRIGNVPLVGAIAGAFPAIVVILSILFYKERLSLGQGLAITGVILGIILSSVDIKNTLKRALHFDRSIKLSLIAFLAWGIFFTFIRTPIETYGWFWANYISTIVGVALAAAIGYRAISLKEIKKPANYIPAVATGLLTGGGTVAFSVAIETGASSIVAPIAGSYPALFALLAYILFKERLTPQQLVGVVITLISIIVLAVLSA